MTAPIPRPIGLNKRSGPLFGLPAGPAADGIAAAKEEAVVVEEAPKAPEEPTPRATPIASVKPAKPKASRLSAATALPVEEADVDVATVRVGLYLRSSVADRAQTAMSDFGNRNAREIRRRGARRNSLNAFLSAILDHALENLDGVDPAEIVSRMPKGR